MPHASVLATLARLRWLSIAGQALVIGLVPVLLPMRLPWLPLAAGVAALLVFNLWARLAMRRGRAAPDTALAHLGVDILVLAWQLYWSGGPANPFVSLLVVPIALAILLLPARAVVATAVMAVAAYSLLWFGHEPLPHVHGEFDLHLFGMWLNFLLTAAVLTFFGTRIAAELARQRADLAAQSERSLRDEGLLAIASLAAGAAHALNTPLATLSVVLDDLRDGVAGSDRESLQDDLALMAAQVEACRAAVGQLVAEARPEQGPVAGQGLGQRLDQAVARWRLLRPGFGVGLDVAGNVAERSIIADRSFDRLVLNLLDNAADASRSVGGERVGLQALRQGGLLVLRFLDEGPGLTAAPTPFQSGRVGGLGLGFALAARVCEQFGGTLAPIRGGVAATFDIARLGPES